MISIPQDIKKEAHKILKIVSAQVFSENINNICDLFSCRLSSIFLLSKLKSIILQIYKSAITLIDEMFLNSKYRKKNFYKSSSAPIERTVIKIFGELHFQRHYYVDKDKKNGFFFIDELFGFDMYKTYDEVVRSILINKSVDENVNKTAERYNLNLLNLE